MGRKPYVLLAAAFCFAGFPFNASSQQPPLLVSPSQSTTTAAIEADDDVPPTPQAGERPALTLQDIDASIVPIRSLTLSSKPAADNEAAGDMPLFPDDKAAVQFGGRTPLRILPSAQTYGWENPVDNRTAPVAHEPLYFEDAPLEKYGYSYGLLQPAASGGRFFGDLALMPIRLVQTPPWTTSAYWYTDPIQSGSKLERSSVRRRLKSAEIQSRFLSQ